MGEYWIRLMSAEVNLRYFHFCILHTIRINWACILKEHLPKSIWQIYCKFETFSPWFIFFLISQNIFANISLICSCWVTVVMIVDDDDHDDDDEDNDNDYHEHDDQDDDHYDTNCRKRNKYSSGISLTSQTWFYFWFQVNFNGSKRWIKLWEVYLKAVVTSISLCFPLQFHIKNKLKNKHVLLVRLIPEIRVE